jgi:ligand-binding SRPBCC domain-containing protein
VVRLEEITVVRAPLERCFDLARSVEAHLAGQRHRGERTTAMGLLGLGERVTWRAKHFGCWQRLTSEITAMDRPRYFQDAMVDGIFRWMRHDHFFRSISPDQTEMRDVFCFAAPLPVLGAIAEVTFLRRYMRALLSDRNAALKRIAESEEWWSYLA